MECNEARELFDLQVDAALKPAAASALEDHLRACSSCRAAYAAIQAESRLLQEAMQADLSSAAEIARMETRVLRAARPETTGFPSFGDWLGPALGTVSGLLVLVGSRFDATGVRTAICLSLSPRGGLPVAIVSVLGVGVAILAVILAQSWIFRTREPE